MRAALVADATAVDVPGWGRKVYIRPLSAREQIDISKLTGITEEQGLRILLVSLIDEDGNRLLANDDFDLLLDQPLPVLVPLLKESARVNGMTEKELEGAIESFGKAQGERNRSG
jgi:hypothetical protein